jgi:predicted dehydrogenase
MEGTSSLAKSKLKVGIIGTGGISGAHINGYQKMADHCEIVALCDIQPDVVKAVGERIGIGPEARYVDHKTMLKEGPKCDVISVCTPNNAHRECTVNSLKAGAHVLCEKPIAGTAKDGEAMVKTAEETGKRLMIGLQNRWNTESQAIKAFIDKGAVGNIYHAKAKATRRRGIPSWGRFIEKDYSTGGPLIDIGVHILDLTLYLIDFPRPVSVMGFCYDTIGPKKPAKYVPWGPWDHKRFDVEDYAVALVRFDGGMSLLLEASWTQNQADEQFNVQVLGDKGGVELDPPRFYGEFQGFLTNTEPVSFPRVNAHEEEIRRFIEAVQKGSKAPTPTPGADALTVQRILDAIYESNEKGCEVQL